MSSPDYDYFDRNAAYEMSKVFAIDITTAAGERGECGPAKCLVKRTYICIAPGLVAACSACEHMLLHLVNVREHMFLEVPGTTYLLLAAARSQEAG